MRRRSVTRAELRKIVADVLEVDPSQLAPEVELGSFQTFDSVAVLTLIIELDEKAGIRLSPSAAGALKRYGDIENVAAQGGVTLAD
jgi:acyl carrier protein